MYIVKSLVPPSFYCRRQVKSIVPSGINHDDGFMVYFVGSICYFDDGDWRLEEE